MLEAFPVSVLVGTVLGFLSGLGVGGGSLLILWLTLVLKLDPAIAREINFLFFLPAAAVSCFFRWKQGVLKLRRILPAAVAGAITAILGTMLSHALDPEQLKKFFGCLLILISIKELCYRKNNSHRSAQ